MSQAQPFSVSESTVHRAAVLHLHGVFDGGAVAVLEPLLAAQLKAESPRVVIDLSDVRYITSAGVGALVNAHRRTRARGGVLVLASPSESLREMFTTLNLGSVLPIHVNLEQGAWAARVG